MDPVALEEAFKVLRLAKATKVHYLDSRDSNRYDAHLDEEGFRRKLPDFISLVREPPVDNGGIYGSNHAGLAPFILITAHGDADPGVVLDSLEVSASVLRELVSVGALPPHLFIMYHLVQAHSSYHLQYDGSNTIPTALYILVRIPRNSRAVHCSLRIRLSDGACVCFINSASPHSLETLMDRAVRQMELLQTCPLHILTFIIEERVPEYQIWHRSLWNSVSKLEAKTGMTPWAAIPTSTSTGHVDPDYKDFTNLLQEMHAANVELNLEETVLRFAEDLLLFCKKLIDVLEKSKLLAGVQDPLKPGHRASLEGQLEYNETILRFMRDKSRELLNRVNAQINVTYSLIAQRDSEQNIRIARLTANDGRTMKTITVLTLTFLPSTMLASLWSAGIFKLESDRSWRIYLGAACALTVIVFTIWYLYVWISTRKPSKTPSEIKVEKVV